jgi:hypothetical protein
MKSVGLKTIAFELNVSVNTVSRALRDCDDISDETKLKVRQKAYELGYMPNNISQFIKRDGKNLISVVVNSFNNLYFNIVCEKLISLFKEKNYDFSLGVRTLGVSVSDFSGELEQITVFENDYDKKARLNTAINSIKDKYGNSSVLKGIVLKDKKFMREDPEATHIVHPDGHI